MGLRVLYNVGRALNRNIIDALDQIGSAPGFAVWPIRGRPEFPARHPVMRPNVALLAQNEEFGDFFKIAQQHSRYP